MALEIEKKFLDQAGVSTLWSRIADAIAAEAEARDTAIGVEKDRAMSAELALADSIGTIPEGSEDVISYVNKKAQEVLDAATGGSQESAASVKLQLDNYKTENDPKVAANTSALATLNGDATTEGSVAKAVANAGLFDYNEDNTWTLSTETNLGNIAEVDVNGGTTKDYQTVSVAHYTHEANTSYSSNMPPYLAVYIWKRIG